MTTTPDTIATIVDDAQYELVAYTRVYGQSHIIIALHRLIDLDVPFAVLTIDEDAERVTSRSNVRKSHLTRDDVNQLLNDVESTIASAR
jgi:hypothetical protein